MILIYGNFVPYFKIIAEKSQKSAILVSAILGIDCINKF